MAAGIPYQWFRILRNLWIVLHLCWAPGANGDVQVPDGVVYTELQRTAEIGEKLVLTCRFYGTPIAVYWKKGVDPTTAPNLITWVEGESASGSCVNDRSCNITGDYSLVIRSVKVSDQGSYICRVSNYLGVLIHNFTEVTVFSAPSKPYPLIEECQPVSNGLQSCRLPASDSVIITCTASRYFPDIDLFFLHESITTNATYSQISEETNVDGTKNKSVSIVARPSENPYVCVASRIPGSQDRRTVSLTVYPIETTVAMTMMTTSQTNQTTPPRQRHVAAKVVVPLILIALVAFFVCIFIWWYKKRQTSNYGKGDLEASPLRPMRDIKGIFNLTPPILSSIDQNCVLTSLLIDLEVPEYLQQEITPSEIQECAHRLTERHVRRLATAVKIKDETKISTIIEENKDVLWVVEQMINDWLMGQECGNYEKRCKLDDAMIEIGRHDMTDSFGTASHRVQSGDDHKREHSYAKYFDCSSLFDDDIESLLRYLPSGAIPMFLEKLGISRSQGDDDIGEKLRCWRDQRIGKPKGCSLQETTAILIESLQETNNNYVLSLTDDDLENIAESMTSPKQMEVLASKLKIRSEGPPLETLKNWMVGSKKDNRRDILWKALTSSELSGCIVQELHAEHVYQPEILRLARNMFLSDVLPLANLLDMNINRRDSQLKGTAKLFLQLLKKSHKLDSVRRRDFSIAIRNLGCLDIARSAYFGYDASLSELCNMVSGLLEDEIVKLMDNLELERDALSVCKGTTGEYDIVRLMEIWKRQHSSGPFHYRLKLAFGLRAAGKTEIARKIIAGDYGTVAVNPDVVKSICNGMGNGQLERLAEHLGLNANGNNPGDTSALVIQWAAGWYKIKKKLFEVKSRKEYIDNLYKAGFVKFAEELMLLEVSRLRPIKQVVDEPCESENQETSEQNESKNNSPIEECNEATVFPPSTDGQDPPSNNENQDTQLTAAILNCATGWFSKFGSFSLLESIKGTFSNEEKSRKKEIDNLYKAGFGRLAEELMLLEVSRLRFVKQGEMALSDDFVDEPCVSQKQETSEQIESENNLPSEVCSEDSSTGVQGTSYNVENEEKQI
ncbi:uncharacterized protein LOC121419570 [Lytechinus variegatus]|uniref:uncharacterized protein LOC121419570 n=1 Tax=Lytechinus variegatus TaxID=7654 RepID=UPI001BB21942|nr:uncharacterized protein LOC121419570 [Lytechinus variegatus]